MADDIKDPKELKEAQEAMDKYVESLKNLHAAEKDHVEAVEKARESAALYLERDDIESRQQGLQAEIDLIDQKIEALGAQDDAEVKSLQAKKEAYSELKDLSMEQAATMQESLEAQSQAFEISKEEMQAFAKTIESAFSTVTDAVMDNLGGIAAGFALFKLDLLPTLDDLKKFAIDMDDARRGIIPFVSTIDKATESQKALAEQSIKTRIPIGDLMSEISPLTDEFRQLNMETPESIASLATLSAQMEKLGAAKGTGGIIESMITDQGLGSIDDAVLSFSALTMQMRELGVTPKELNEDFKQLIPTFAMFGSAATGNMAQISMQSKSMKVDVGSITAFAENFSGYQDAAKAAQTINAVFGKSVIRDPAELVRVFYTQGPEAILPMVIEKLEASGAEIDPESAAGRAQIRALKQALGGTEQDIMRMLGFEGDLTEGQQAIEDVTAPGAIDTPEVQQLAGQFDSLTQATVTLGDQMTSLKESIMAGGLDKIGLGFGEIGVIGDNIIGHLGTFSQNIIEAITIPDEIKNVIESIKTIAKTNEGFPEFMKALKDLLGTLPDLPDVGGGGGAGGGGGGGGSPGGGTAPTIPGGEVGGETPGKSGTPELPDTLPGGEPGGETPGKGATIDTTLPDPGGEPEGETPGKGGTFEATVMPKLDTGGAVMSDGIAYLHSGEEVMTPAEVMNNTTNTDTIMAMRTAIDNMSAKMENLAVILEKEATKQNENTNQQVQLVIDDRKSFKSYIVSTAHDGINKMYNV